MPDLGKSLIAIGILIAGAGVLILLAAKLGMHRLPGDIVIRRGNFTFAFPIVTCIVVSLILTLVLSLVSRWR